MKVTEFKGHKILVLSPDTDDEVRIGLRKAKTILAPDNLTQLRRFVQEFDRPKVEPVKAAPVVAAPAPTASSPDMAKELADLRAQLAAVTASLPAAVKEKPGRFAARP